MRAARILTKGPKGPLLGHQGEETGLQGICDDDIKKLFEILPVTARETTLTSVTGAWPLCEGQCLDSFQMYLSYTSTNSPVKLNSLYR